MTDERWRSLPLMVKLSNIAGEVKRCVDCRLDFNQGISSEDFSTEKWTGIISCGIGINLRKL